MTDLDLRDKALARLSTVLDVVERVAQICIAALVVVILAVVTSQIVHRYIVRVPLAAPDEYAKMAMVWIAFLGFSLAYRRGEAVRIDLIDHYLPRVSAVLTTVFEIVTISLLGLLVVKGWDLFVVGQGQSILGTPFSAAYTYAAFVTGMVMMVIFSAERLLKRLARPTHF